VLPSVIGTESVGIVLDTINLVDLTRGDLLNNGTQQPLGRRPGQSFL
jgi:hypothetical protein